MTAIHPATHPATRAQRAQPKKAARRHGLPALPLLVLLAGIGLAAGAVAWLLWPRWPAPQGAVDAPSLPITVQGVTFNIPPGAVRLKAQRKPGAQERIDLFFMWPALTPPAERPVPAAASDAIDRIFVTIAASESALAPLERVKTIYPRYLDDRVGTSDGLAVRPFRTGTPYQNEDILYDPADPERFFTRCTRDGAAGMIGMCLYQRRIGAADVTVRFPRQWLSGWMDVREGVERLLAGLRASGG